MGNFLLSLVIVIAVIQVFTLFIVIIAFRFLAPSLSSIERDISRSKVAFTSLMVKIEENTRSSGSSSFLKGNSQEPSSTLEVGHSSNSEGTISGRSSHTTDWRSFVE